MKISAIDIGSNSVRLACVADGKTLYKRLATTRLGEGLSFTGKLSPAAITRTATAVSEFAQTAKEEGAQKIYAFATAAVRSAENGTEFVSLVKSLCGLQVDVLSGEQEAQCGILGALQGNDGGIIDVGGASTEVTLQQNGKTLYSKSVDCGAVRLFDLAARNLQKLEAVIQSKIQDYGADLPACSNMYAIGGTATTIASVKHKLKAYNPAITHGTVLTQAEVYALAQKLLSLSVEEVRALDGMEPRRADVIGGGCLLLAAVMQKFSVPQITVSENDNLEGYIILKEGAL